MDLKVLLLPRWSKRWHPRVNPQYRGVDGIGPDVPYEYETLGIEHLLYRALWDYMEAQDGRVVHDLTVARAVVEAYRCLDPPKYYEVIEVTRGTNLPETTHHRFLGFDVANDVYDSVLVCGLTSSGEGEKTTEDDLLRTLYPLGRLIEAYFSPRLNSNGLFDDYATACFCLECTMALQKLYPGLYEFGDYEVLGIWEVLEDSTGVQLLA